MYFKKTDGGKSHSFGSNNAVKLTKSVMKKSCEKVRICSNQFAIPAKKKGRSCAFHGFS